MPKEVTYGICSDETFNVEVGWSREPNGNVQVATVTDQVDVLRDLAPAQDQPAADRTGIYVSLDRVSLNKLIRDLRRARDQAYGRDE